MRFFLLNFLLASSGNFYTIKNCGNLTILSLTVKCGDLENAPEFTDWRGDGRLVYPPAGEEQAILPSYKIKRCGKVVFWAAYVHSLSGKNTGDFSIQFQVWRAVGDSFILVNTSTMPPTRASNNRVELTLAEHEQFNVEAGDVIGYLQRDCNSGVQVLRTMTNTKEYRFRVKRNDVKVQRSLSTTVQGSPVITLS